MNSESKYIFPRWWDILIMVLLILAGQIIPVVASYSLGVSLNSLIEILKDVTIDMEEHMDSQILLGEKLAVLYPLTMLFSILAVWIYAKLRGVKGRVISSSINGFNPNIIIVGFLWMITLQLLLEPVLRLLPEADVNVGRGLWAFFTACVSAPILEEVLFRGLLIGYLRKSYSVGVSIVISSVMFGLLHGTGQQAVAATVSGVILGMVFVRSSSIFSTIILHSMNNTIAYALMAVGLGNAGFSDLFANKTIYWIVYGVMMFIFLFLTGGYIRSVALFVRKELLKFQ